MYTEIKNKLTQLNHLLESAQNPKILWEEMQLVSERAFSLQDELMILLEEAENTEQDIQELQNIFTTREIVWDAVAQIAKQEMIIKEKTYKKKTNAAKSETSARNRSGCCRHKKTESCSQPHNKQANHKGCVCHDNACHEQDLRQNNDSAHTHTCQHRHGGCCHTNNGSSFHEKTQSEDHCCNGGCSCKKKK